MTRAHKAKWRFVDPKLSCDEWVYACPAALHSWSWRESPKENKTNFAGSVGGRKRRFWAVTCFHQSSDREFANKEQIKSRIYCRRKFFRDEIED